MEPQDAAADRNPVETFLRNLPGFRGYLDKEYRRESDAMIRQWLAERLQRAKRALDDRSRLLVQAGQLAILPEIDRLRGRVDKLIGRIQGAMQGYSAFFGMVRVDEQRLDELYEYDRGLTTVVDELAVRIERLPSVADEIAAAIAALFPEVDDVQGRWDRRDNLLRGWN